MKWATSGCIAVMIGNDDRGGTSSIVRDGPVVGVGSLRLENRDEVARSAGIELEVVTDLDLVVRLFRRRGAISAAALLGDFAFVVCDTSSLRVEAARDVFGVKTLYYSARRDLVAFCSRAEMLADGEAYDSHFLTEFVGGVAPSFERTVFACVSAVPPASQALVSQGRISITRYWSPATFEPEAGATADSKICEFRELFSNAVTLSLTGKSDTWAELSGGLDSSSIVSMAQALVKAGSVQIGVAGTVSYGDSVGAGADEREYSEAVVRQFGLRNEVLMDFVPWQNDGMEPPLTDAPDGRYLLYARDRMTHRVVARAGGTVLLSGLGSDHYLMGNMLFFADQIVRGSVFGTLRNMVEWAALGRVSFWQLAYLNALLPLLPPLAQRVLVPGGQVPRWIPKRQVERLNLKGRQIALGGYAGPIGKKYPHEVAFAVNSIPLAVDHGVLADNLEIRYPFFHRPLVEFALRLPPTMCRRPNARKWILRQAMLGVLPETIRTRRWKGTFDGRIVWSLIQNRDLIKRLLREPILAQLGCIDPIGARTDLIAASQGDAHALTGITQLLALETWLQVQSGRWLAPEAQSAPTNQYPEVRGDQSGTSFTRSSI